jgi:putative oxidoreductase
MPKASTASSSADLGLLVLRLIAATSLFLKHGTEKLFHFSAMAQHFPNPVHIGSLPTLVIALIADAICMPLLVLGLFTRWAALFSFCNLLVAWALVHHYQFAGRGGEHGELIVVYMGVMLTLAIAGPGRHSLDARSGRA